MPTAAGRPRFGPQDVPTSTQMRLFSPRGFAVVTGKQYEILVVRATPPPPGEDSPAAQVEMDPFILPASTAPALLEPDARPKRARGRTLDYKAMRDGKQSQPKRGREARKLIGI